MKPAPRILILLFALLILPVLLFSAYEISTLRENEAMIEQIYEKQLETILFSVNQYADDIVTGWTTKVDATANTMPPEKWEAAWQSLLQLHGSLQGIFITDSVHTDGTASFWAAHQPTTSPDLPGLAQQLAIQADKLAYMKRKKQMGYQKVEVFPQPDAQVIVFAAGNPDSLWIAGLVIDPELFIEEILGPKMQTIAQDQLILSVYPAGEGPATYSTQTADTAARSQSLASRPLWNFPSYTLGIRPQGSRLQTLVRERTQNNLYWLGGAALAMLVAAWLTFRNVQQEVQLAQNKADFIANVSHEIRTPLSLIQMFSETLALGRAPTEEKKQSYYEILAKESQRLTSIVNRILNFSKTADGKRPLQFESIDLGLLIKEIYHTYELTLQQAGFETHLQIAEGINVWGDRAALGEIIVNLLDNAMKYSTTIRWLRLACEREGAFARLAVEDKGLGIERQHLKHIFEKFYRVPAGDLARTRGTGLGLALVKQLVEMQKGKIEVASTPGQGSTFVVRIPLSKSTV